MLGDCSRSFSFHPFQKRIAFCIHALPVSNVVKTLRHGANKNWSRPRLRIRAWSSGQSPGIWGAFAGDIKVTGEDKAPSYVPCTICMSYILRMDSALQLPKDNANNGLASSWSIPIHI